ncbi:MAG TPA: alkaline phosphatase [Terriglobia bacterium]|nr:alkaline phosphatase [Terriglobia bacterium]
MRHLVVGLVIGLALTGSAWAEATLRVIPPSGATFAPGQRFDVRLEGDDLRAQPGQFTIEVNGRDQKREIFGTEEFRIFPAPQTGRGSNNSGTLNGGVIRRNWSLEKPGKYEIKATLTTADGKKLTATSTFEVETLQPAANRARNVILFIGDGMGPAIRTAARIVSKGVEGGRARGLLEMDQMETLGLVMTSSLDALVTDSSPGAGAWATGNKSINNWHGVFPDNNSATTAIAATLDRSAEAAAPFLDNPRVENLAEFLQRTRRMSTGVVSTVAVTDSTPGAFSSHAIRYAQTSIAEQMLSAGHSVILGGGAKFFLPQGNPLLANIPSSRSDGRNLVDEFKNAGFSFVSTASELEHAGRAEKLLGFFHGGEMSSRYDRMRAKAGISAGKEAVGQFPDQPTLELMTRQALNVLGKNPNGFFLMIEAGSIDRELHRMDPNRAVDELIELDKAIGIARAWVADRDRDDTLILVTSDHETSGLTITGVNEKGRPSGRSFPNYEDLNFDGFPDDFQPELSITFDFASAYNPPKDSRVYDLPRNLKELNPTTNVPPGQIPSGGAAGHSAVDVQVSARGPGASLFGGVQDNTQIFFKILRALGEK